MGDPFMKSYGLTPFLKSPAKHVDVLDYTRGIAILFVLFSHTLGSVNEQFIQTWDSTWEGLFRNLTVPVSSLFPTLFDFGKVGVAIFFVVSGFCIHTSFQQQGQKWRGFFIRRFFRIYPAYLAALIYFVFLYPSNPKLIVHGQTIWIQLLTHLFLVHNLFQDTYTAFNGAFWSLGVEAQLYALYPVLLFIVAKYGWRRTMVILAGCELLIRGADGLIQTIDATNTVPGQISWLFSASPLGYWFSWSLGAFIADAYLKKQPLPFLNTSLAPWLFLTLMCNFIKPLLPFLFLFSAVTTAIVVCKCLSGRISIIKVPALLLDILKMFGLWSYSIYLLHAPLYQAYSFSIAWFIPDECLSRLLLLLIIFIPGQ
jgi:peptidoglycan/LPS O-acetylase OafA/YrhL